MPCPLADLIQSDMVSAMKSRDERRLSVLRMLKTSMQLASTEKGRDGELSEGDILTLARRGIKQREEAAEVYERGGAPERAENELEEAKILASYLPAQMDDASLEEAVKGVAVSVGAAGPKDMGRVMSAAMKELSGRADGRKVKEAVQKILAG